MSPMEVESRARFQDSAETGVVATGTCVAVIPGVADMVPVTDSVLTGDADCWVHPAAKRNAATRTHASSTVRTGEVMVKGWDDEK